MRRWKTTLVQSSRDSSQKCSEASRTVSLDVVFLLPSLTPPEKCVCVSVCMCVLDVGECVSAKRERCGVAPFSEVLDLFPPPLFLPSFLPSCYKLNALRRCCRLCLSHSFSRSRSLYPFFPLAHSHSACSLAAFPLSSSSSPVIILLHHSQRSSVVLQHCSPVCRVQPLEGDSCTRAQGEVHRWKRHPCRSAGPTYFCCHPSVF